MSNSKLIERTSKYFFTIISSLLIVSAIVYAVDITNLTQTANTGDKITAQWVNAVNNNSNNSASAAGGSDIDCVVNSGFYVCINKITGKTCSTTNASNPGVWDCNNHSSFDM